jgi:hypothetical protein
MALAASGRDLMKTLFSFALAVSAAATVFAGSRYQYVHAPDADLYFGHVSYCESELAGPHPVVLRNGARPEPATVNLPLAPGDVVRTTAERRCEIQFDTGTLVRLDGDTELGIETILAPTLSTSENMTNLVLERGRIYIMYKRYARSERFQVITPNAAVKMDHGTVATVAVTEEGASDVEVRRGKAQVLFGPGPSETRSLKVGKLGRLVIATDHEATAWRRAEATAKSAFEQWNESTDGSFEALHRGISHVPRPVRRYPDALIYFAEKYSHAYGEWVWSDLYGYVWRPFFNDEYLSGRWRPYSRGSWRDIKGELFWVPEEIWGRVPYHLGTWVWMKELGWVWIPGSAFAPAWVSWGYFRGYCWWRPLGPREAYRTSIPHATLSADGSVAERPPAVPRPDDDPPPEDDDRRGRRRNDGERPFPRQRGELGVRLEHILEDVTVIRVEDVEAPRVHERALSREEITAASLPAGWAGERPGLVRFPGARTASEPGWDTSGAPDILRLPAPRSPILSELTPDETRAGVLAAREPVTRFRDWNRQDVQTAESLGVSLRHSSRDNRVRSPELGDRAPRVFQASRRRSIHTRWSDVSPSGGSSDGAGGGGDGGSSAAISTASSAGSDRGGGSRVDRVK